MKYRFALRATLRRKRRLKEVLVITGLTVWSLAVQTSCSLMKEDRSDCDDCRNLLRIVLRYDYNTQRANMFSDHVEQATVYVVDATTGMVVDRMTACNTAEAQPLRDPSFGFNFEGLTAGKYKLYATGQSAADATVSVTEPGVAQDISGLTFTLPSTEPAERLDTVWNTLKPTSITLQENEPMEAVVPLMRLTNDLNVMVFRHDHPAENSHERYDIFVTDEHAVLGYDNEPINLTPIIYRPFSSWTTETGVAGGGAVGTVAERGAHYDFSLLRLMVHGDARRNARLVIRNRVSGHEIVNIDLCYYLALARNAYESRHYGPQEYLDREYDYRLSFVTQGDGEQETWKYVAVSIDVMAWTIRIQNETL